MGDHPAGKTRSRSKVAKKVTGGRFFCPPCRFSSENISPEFSKLADKLKLNVTFHGRRHTHNTLLLLYNVNPKLVADRSGHDIKLAMDQYLHVMPECKIQLQAYWIRSCFRPPKVKMKMVTKKIGNDPATVCIFHYRGLK